MKKIFMALVLILCLALPAMAAPQTVTTVDELRKAIADSSVERIIISGDITLPANIPASGGMTYCCGLLVNRDLTLQINKGCKLSIVGTSTDMTVGIFNQDKSLTITGQGIINVTDSSSGYSVGVNAEGQYDEPNAPIPIVNIADGVTITASGGDEMNASVGVYKAKVNILNAVLNGDLYQGSGGWSTVKIYDGTFTDSKVSTSQDVLLGTGCTVSGTGSYTVSNSATETLSPDKVLSLDVTNGEASGAVAVKLTLDATDATSIETSFDAIVVTPEKEVDGLSYDDVSEKDGTITFTATQDCAAGEYKFRVAACGNDGTHYLGQETKEGEEITVQVTNTKKSSGGSSNGCNAGFGALALAAVAAIAAAKHRK